MTDLPLTRRNLLLGAAAAGAPFAIEAAQAAQDPAAAPGAGADKVNRVDTTAALRAQAAPGAGNPSATTRGFREMADEGGGVFFWDEARGLTPRFVFAGAGLAPGSYRGTPIVGGGGSGATATVTVTGDGSYRTIAAATALPAGTGLPPNRTDLTVPIVGGARAFAHVDTNARGQVTAVKASLYRGTGLKPGTYPLGDEFSHAIGVQVGVTVGGTVTALTVDEQGSGYQGIAALDTGAFVGAGVAPEIFIVSDDQGLTQAAPSPAPPKGRWVPRRKTYISLREIGARGDGTARPLSATYASLAAAQKELPHVTALSQTEDWALTQLAWTLAERQDIEADGAAYMMGNSPLVWRRRGDSSGLVMRGRGMQADGTRFVFARTPAGGAMKVDGSSLQPYEFAWGVQLDNFAIEHDGGPAADAAGLDIIGQWLGGIRRLRIIGFDHGIVFPRADWIYPNPDGYSSTNLDIQHCCLELLRGWGILGSAGLAAPHMNLTDSLIRLCTKGGVWAGGSGWTIARNTVAANGSQAYYDAVPALRGGGGMIIGHLASDERPHIVTVLDNEYDGNFGFNEWIAGCLSYDQFNHRSNSDEALNAGRRPPVCTIIGYGDGMVASARFHNVLPRTNFSAATPEDGSTLYQIDSGLRAGKQHVVGYRIDGPKTLNISPNTRRYSRGGGAVLAAELSRGGLSGATVKQPGIGYVAGETEIVVSGDGKGAAATVALDAAGGVTGVTITAPGSGYSRIALAVSARELSGLVANDGGLILEDNRRVWGPSVAEHSVRRVTDSQPLPSGSNWVTLAWNAEGIPGMVASAWTDEGTFTVRQTGTWEAAMCLRLQGLAAGDAVETRILIGGVPAAHEIRAAGGLPSESFRCEATATVAKDADVQFQCRHAGRKPVGIDTGSPPFNWVRLRLQP